MCDSSEKRQKRPKYKFGQKCTKFGNILKKRQPHACDYCMHNTARICLEFIKTIVDCFAPKGQINGKVKPINDH